MAQVRGYERMKIAKPLRKHRALDRRFLERGGAPPLLRSLLIDNWHEVVANPQRVGLEINSPTEHTKRHERV
jgi:hypothetical protein